MLDSRQGIVCRTGVKDSGFALECHRADGVDLADDSVGSCPVRLRFRFEVRVGLLGIREDLIGSVCDVHFLLGGQGVISSAGGVDARLTFRRIGDGADGVNLGDHRVCCLFVLDGNIVREVLPFILRLVERDVGFRYKDRDGFVDAGKDVAAKIWHIGCTAGNHLQAGTVLEGARSDLVQRCRQRDSSQFFVFCERSVHDCLYAFGHDVCSFLRGWISTEFGLCFIEQYAVQRAVVRVSGGYVDSRQFGAVVEYFRLDPVHGLGNRHGE